MRTEPHPMAIRVEHVITKLAVGGAQESALVTCSGLSFREFDQQLLTGAEVDEEGDLFAEAGAAGVEVVVVPPLVRAIDPWRDLAAVVWLVRHFRERRPHVVHTHSSKAGILGRLAAVVAGVPVVVHSVHGWSFHDHMSNPSLWLVSLVERVAAELTDVLVIEARTDLRKGLDRGIGHEGKYRLIRNGIDLERFLDDVIDRSQARRSLGLPDDVPVVGTVGRLAEQKAPFAMVDAMAELLREHPEARFVWVGDGPLRHETEDRARSLGIDDSFILAGVRRDIPRVLRAFDVFALSSLWEGLPRTVTEAMASEVPVVATQVDGLTDAVTPGENGLLVPPADPGALAESIDAVLASPALAHKLRAGGRKRALEFDRREMLRRIAAVYRESVAAPLGDRPLRVAHIITGLEVGGAELMLARLVASPELEGIEQSVWSLTTRGPVSEQIERAGVPVVALGMDPRTAGIDGLGRLVRALRSYRPDVTQTWLYHADLLGGIAGRLVGSPVVWNLRMGNLDVSGGRRTNAVARLCGPLSRSVPNSIVSNSEEGVHFHAGLGYDADRALVIPNGFDVERFRPDPDAGRHLRAELGVPAEVSLVGVIARLHPQKDHRGFLRALAMIRSEHPAVVGVLCGRGCSGESDVLGRWIREEHLEGSVRLLGVRPDVERVIAGLDVLVCPSAFGEAFPNAVGEALSCGVPVVATDVGDTAALLRGIGSVVPASDPRALAEAVLGVLREPEAERQTRAEAGRRRVVDRWSMPVVAEAYRALWEQVSVDHPVRIRRRRRPRR